MSRSTMLAALAAMMLAPEPGRRTARNRRRRVRPTRHAGKGAKVRCRTLERFRTERAVLGPPITSRFAIRTKAFREALRAAGYHVEPMPEVDDA